MACYLRGTRILIPHGEVCIEAVQIGQYVSTLDGPKAIRWIGRRSYSREFIFGNRDVLPVRIERGALGLGLPRRDLCVSPQHALLIDGSLIPASALVNGVSIRQDTGVDAVSYFHLQFDSHAVIFAEGAAAESFVDDYSRAMFDNVADYAARFPLAIREPARFCAPRIEKGVELEIVRRRLTQRSPRSGKPADWSGGLRVGVN